MNPVTARLDRYAIPLSVREAVLEALEEYHARCAAANLPPPTEYPWDELNLPNDLKGKLVDCIAVGFWRGPQDPPRPWE